MQEVPQDMLRQRGIEWGSTAHVELTVSQVKFQTQRLVAACSAAEQRQEKRACQCGHKCMCDYGRVNKALLSLFLAMREVTLR